MAQLRAPFPWFGGKRKVAHEVWSRFGSVQNYVEPFFGSGAMLLGRPEPFDGNETINDIDGYVSNFWRAIQHDPQSVATWADQPVNENDLHARHVWLVQQSETLRSRLEGDPEFFDVKIAGWWAWGVSSWIGSGFCSGRGPWWVDDNRRLVHWGDNGRGVNRKLVHLGDNGRGVNRKLVHLGDNGRGVNRQLVHLDDNGRGVKRKIVHLGDKGQGVNRQLVHLGNNGRGVDRQLVHLGNNGRGVGLTEWFAALSARLRHVRVASGDWTRVCGPSVTTKHGLTGVFLDPPYADTALRCDGLYREDSLSVAHEVREWAIAHGDDPLMRIALCGYDGEHEMPSSWMVYRWKARGGYGNQAENRTNNETRECIWFSPRCLVTMPSLFDQNLIDHGA